MLFFLFSRTFIGAPPQAGPIVAIPLPPKSPRYKWTFGLIQAESSLWEKREDYACTQVRYSTVPTACCLAWRFEKEPSGLSRGSKKLLGDELQLILYGGVPKDAKPFKGIGSGVLEIALRYKSDAYRVVLALQLGRRIYILHAFQKKSKWGIATPKREVDLIKRRYTEAQELAHDYEKTKIN